jgi:hypothetical protein
MEVVEFRVLVLLQLLLLQALHHRPAARFESNSLSLLA